LIKTRVNGLFVKYVLLTRAKKQGFSRPFFTPQALALARAKLTLWAGDDPPQALSLGINRHCHRKNGLLAVAVAAAFNRPATNQIHWTAKDFSLLLFA
jgi:hypothetical protein